ncbi:threonylcarbamoyl-AMP synthase [Candidatus Uhrbacteria bacterium]|nr:threonylcarbamoyl-AMP synthase [Candidatus Uhrbacteria bacterium]
MLFSSLNSKKLVSLLKSGAIGVIPTDTIYGISASVKKPETIERLYDIRLRDRSKPFIVLIGSVDDLALFDIALEDSFKATLMRIWPAPVSIVLPSSDDAHAHLHRGTRSLAFRVPDDARLRALLKKTGPLITTSANPEGKKPATTIAQAQNYFGNSLDFYVDAGKRKGKPSTLLRHDGASFTVIRQGTYHLPDLKGV